MKKNLLIVLFCFTNFSVFGQNNEEEAVKNTIQKFFDGMRSKDSTMISQTLDASVRLQTVGQKDGIAFVRTESIENFLKMIATPRKEVFDERILSYEIRIDGQMATAWTPYEFYIDQNFSHCGVNAFQFFKSPQGWKIVQIIDTRRKENCKK